MKRLLFLILFCSSICYAQGNRVDGVISVRSGQPASGARIAVCSQPAVTTSAPCSPLVTLYTDSTLVTPCAGTLLPPNVPGSPCSNPMTADGLGNYHFYAPPAVYTLMFYGPSTATFIQPDFSLTLSGGPVTNANLPNPMNLTNTLTVTTTGGVIPLRLNVANTGFVFNFTSAAFPSATFGGLFQAPGSWTFGANSGSGMSQFLLTSNGFGFVPAVSGGVFGFGTSGGSWQATTDTGKLTQYNSAATAGNGQPAIRAVLNQTGEVTGNSGTLTLYTPVTNSGMYRVVVYTVISTNAAGSTVQWTVNYTDVTGARTTVGTSIAGDTAGTHLGETFIIESESAVAITISNATASSPKYKFYVRLEEL